jgi:hypothetical protein
LLLQLKLRVVRHVKCTGPLKHSENGRGRFTPRKRIRACSLSCRSRWDLWVESRASP